MFTSSEPKQPTVSEHWQCHRQSSPYHKISKNYTLYVRAVFAVVQCLSVRPSVTFVYCIQTAEDTVKLLVRPGSTIILVLWPRAPTPNPTGNPFSRGTKYTGLWENFDWSTVYLKNGTRYAHECSQVADWSVSVPMTFSDLERRNPSKGQIVLNNGHIVWRRTTKFGRITHWGSSVFLGGQRCPYHKGRGGGPSAPKFGGSFLFMHNPLTQNYQIWYGNTCEDGHVFWGQPRVPSQEIRVPGLPWNFGVLLYVCLHPLMQNQIWHGHTYGEGCVLEGHPPRRCICTSASRG